MLYQIYPSQQVIRYATIAHKHEIYDLPHELPNDLKFSMLEN